MGTEIFFEKPGSDGAEPQPDKKWTQLLDQGWNRQAALNAAAQLSELAPQVITSMHQSNITLHCKFCFLTACGKDAELGTAHMILSATELEDMLHMVMTQCSTVSAFWQDCVCLVTVLLLRCDQYSCLLACAAAKDQSYAVNRNTRIYNLIPTYTHL